MVFQLQFQGKTKLRGAAGDLEGELRQVGTFRQSKASCREAGWLFSVAGGHPGDLASVPRPGLELPAQGPGQSPDASVRLLWVKC